MASLGHVAVGMVGARLQGGGAGRMLFWSALSLLPRRGLYVMAVEALWSLPLFAFALWPRRARPR